MDTTAEEHVPKKKKKLLLILLGLGLPGLFFIFIFTVILFIPLMIFSGDAVTADYGNDIYYAAELYGISFKYGDNSPLQFPFITQNSNITISSGFGIREDPINGTESFHKGIDFPIPRGTPVLASEDGTATYAGVNGGYGNFIEIDHGEGLTSRYGHLSGISVHVGDKVSRGDVIGASGSTGRSTGPHLHFEVRQDNVPVNPAYYISLQPQIPSISVSEIAYQDVEVSDKECITWGRKYDLNPLLLLAIKKNDTRSVQIIAEETKELLQDRPATVNVFIWLNQNRSDEFWWVKVSKDYGELKEG